MLKTTNNLKRKLLLTCVGLLLSVPMLLAQTYQITGKVTDGDNLTLPGVNVLIKGTAIGTITDTDGAFSINVPNGNQIIIFSFVGYRTQEISVSGGQNLAVVLEDDLAALEEVVVVGYGTEVKRNVTGSVASVKSEDITRLKASSLDVGLQGMASGVQVSQSSGAIGSPVRVLVRGVNTISNTSEPLYVIDGIPLDPSTQAINGTGRGGIAQNPLSLINPNDIESVEILKDAAATAIYGNRGSNGVIIVTTKKGKQGRAQVSIDYSAGVTDLTRDADDVGYVNGPEYLALVDEARANSGLDPLEFENLANPGDNNAVLPRENFANTNWFDRILRTGSFHDLNVSASKGFEGGNYYFSANYRRDNGVLENNSADRFTSRLNLEYEPIKNIKTGLRFTFAHSETQRVRSGGGGTPSGNDQVGKGGFGEATRGALPIFPVTNEDLSFFNPTSGHNLVASIGTDFQRDQITFDRILGGTFLEYALPFVKGLSLRSEVSFDIIQTRNIYWASALIRPNNSAFGHENNSTSRNINYNIYATFNRTFGDHAINLVVGGEWQRFNAVTTNIIGEDLRGVAQEIGGTPGTVLNASAGLGGERNLAAQFARFTYTFKDRYIISFSERYDGSSVFQEENRWQPFFAGSVGWIISDENFMDNLTPISFLKLRASYGESGNQYISNTATETTFLDWPAYSLTTNAIELSNLGVPTLTWETTETFEVGLDFGIFNDRINGSIGWYQQDSRDLLLQVPVPQSAGLQFAGNNIWANVGDIRNRGFEFNINSVNIVTNNFKWTTSFNISTNENEVLNLTEELDQDQRGVTSGLTLTKNGLPLGTFFIAEHAGVDPETGVDLIYAIDQRATIDGDPNPGFNQRMQGENGQDSVLVAHRNNVNGNRRILDKSGLPTFFGGITNTLDYKGLELSFVFTFQGGNYIYDTNEEAGSFIGTGSNILRRDLIGNTWTQPGDQAEYPQLVWNRRYAVNRDGSEANSANQRFDRTNSTRFLHKGDFLRLRTIQIAYNFPSQMVSKIGLSGLRVFVAANNLFTITGYDGWDPEQYNFTNNTQNRNLQQGVVGAQVPQLRTFLGGISVKF